MDQTLDSMEETRFRKKYNFLFARLSKKLHFTHEEVEALMIIYYKILRDNDDPDMQRDGITKRQFKEVLHNGFDMTDELLIERILVSLHKNSPMITMESWARAMSLLLRGTLEEKIVYCFSCYDIYGDGLIGRETMFSFLRHAIIGQGNDDDSDDGANDMVEVIIKKMDMDRDGKISFEDYKQSVLKSPMLLEVLGPCLPSRIAIQGFLTTFSINVNPAKI